LKLVRVSTEVLNICRELIERSGMSKLGLDFCRVSKKPRVKASRLFYCFQPKNVRGALSSLVFAQRVVVDASRWPRARLRSIRSPLARAKNTFHGQTSGAGR
jgi:hypothetical protein